MTKTIDIREANLEELLQWVREGADVILTDGGTPLAQLTPLNACTLDFHRGGWMSDDCESPLCDKFWAEADL
jgi:antitoxin (DNA-binding transcriptional repressor) of toxin-antitoxin stability system